jgi:ABC-type metal ion transport system substrate-binding protein
MKRSVHVLATLGLVVLTVSSGVCALVEDLTKSLNKIKVGKAEQDQLLGVLGPMRAQIVETK